MTNSSDSPLVSLHFERPPAGAFKSAQDALSNAQAYEIDCPEMYEMAGTELQRIKTLQRNVEAQRTTITGPMNQALDAVNAFFKQPKDWLTKAEALLKNAMLFYDNQEKLKREAAQKVLDEAARRERVRIAEEAAAAREAGRAEEAVMLEQTSELISAPTAPPAAKLSGISTRTTWTYEVVDASLIPREYWVLDEQKLAGVARALKGAMNVPGVKPKEVKSIASRAA